MIQLRTLEGCWFCPSAWQRRLENCGLLQNQPLISVSVPPPCYDDDGINFVCVRLVSVSVPPPCYDDDSGIRSTPML